MKLVRLRPRADRLPVIEVEQEFLFASTVLVHIERLPNVRVLAKKASILSDSFEAVFELAEHRFSMSQPFGCITIEPYDNNTPRDIIDRLAAHIDSYRTVWPTQLLWAMGRYLLLPSSPAEQGEKVLP